MTKGYRSFKQPDGLSNVALRMSQSDCCHISKSRCVVSPVYESYGNVFPVAVGLPVSGKGPFGSALKFATRVSASRIWSVTGLKNSAVCSAPEAPVVSRTRSAVSSDGSIAPKNGRSATGNGGGSPVTGLGEKFRLGSGSVV